MLDRFSKPISEGAQVLVELDITPMMVVVGVRPVLEPNAPPGLIKLQLVAQVEMMCVANSPSPNLVVVGSQPARAETDTNHGTDTADPPAGRLPAATEDGTRSGPLGLVPPPAGSDPPDGGG